MFGSFLPTSPRPPPFPPLEDYILKSIKHFRLLHGFVYGGFRSICIIIFLSLSMSYTHWKKLIIM
jgi:hypothetical protein